MYNKWICLKYLVARIKIKEDLCVNQKSDKIIKDFMLIRKYFGFKGFWKFFFCEYKGEKKEGINWAGARFSMN